MRFCETSQTIRPPRLGRTALLLAGLALTIGCDNPDTEGRFNEFGEKTADRRGAGDAGTPDGGQQVDFSGTYLLALTTTLAPTAPLYIQADITVDTSDFTIDFVFQPLKTDLDGTDPRSDARTAVGAEIVVNDVPLTESGQFDVDLGVVAVAGSANPISGGDIVAEIQLQGFVLSESSWCGTATGDVTAPTALPLGGSTFGTVPLEGDITLLDPVGKCVGGVIDVPDMGDTDMGTAPPFIRCPVGLEGDYDFVFKADVSTARTQVTMTLVAGDGVNSPCYTGQLISQLDGTTVVGNVDFVDDKDTVLTAFVPDFMIPPGASPLLPDGGVASLELRASAWNLDGACGDLTFSLESPAISSEGGFLMLRAGTADFTLDPDLAIAGCDAIIPAAPCGLESFVGTYQLSFITETTQMLGGDPSVVEMTLESHPLTCLGGTLVSTLDPTLKLADVGWAAVLNTDQIEIQTRNFLIPPNPDNPVAFVREGGRADVGLRSSMAVAGTSFCGGMGFDLFDPVVISSGGTFAADQTAPATSACP